MKNPAAIDTLVHVLAAVAAANPAPALIPAHDVTKMYRRKDVTYAPLCASVYLSVGSHFKQKYGYARRSQRHPHDIRFALARYRPGAWQAGGRCGTGCWRGKFLEGLRLKQHDKSDDGGDKDEREGGNDDARARGVSEELQMCEAGNLWREWSGWDDSPISTGRASPPISCGTIASGRQPRQRLRRNVP